MILQQKGFSTSVTRELAVVGVPVHMRKESSGSIKYLTAMRTRFLRPDLMVADFDVVGQLTLKDKFFIALTAGFSLFTVACTRVLYSCVWRRQCLVTEFALVH